MRWVPDHPQRNELPCMASVLSGSQLRCPTKTSPVMFLPRRETVKITARVNRVSRKHALYVYATRDGATTSALRVAIRGAGTRSIKRRECSFGVRGIADEAMLHTLRMTFGAEFRGNLVNLAGAGSQSGRPAFSGCVILAADSPP